MLKETKILETSGGTTPLAEKEAPRGTFFISFLELETRSSTQELNDRVGKGGCRGPVLQKKEGTGFRGSDVYRVICTLLRNYCIQGINWIWIPVRPKEKGKEFKRVSQAAVNLG